MNYNEINWNINLNQSKKKETPSPSDNHKGLSLRHFVPKKNLGTGGTAASTAGLLFFLPMGIRVGTGSTAALLIKCFYISKLPNKQKFRHHYNREATPHLSEKRSFYLHFDWLIKFRSLCFCACFKK